MVNEEANDLGYHVGDLLQGRLESAARALAGLELGDKLADRGHDVRHHVRAEVHGLVADVLEERRELAALTGAVLHLAQKARDRRQRLRGHPRRELVDIRQEHPADLLRQVAHARLELVRRRRLSSRRTAELLVQLLEDDLLRAHRVARLHERLDLLLLLSREGDADLRQGGDALDRVVQRLAELDRRRLRVLPERDRHVRHERRRLREDVVTLAGLVLDVRERQEQVLPALNRLVVVAGLVRDRRREVAHLVGAQLRGLAGRLDDLLGLRANLLRLARTSDRLRQEVLDPSRSERSGQGGGDRLRDTTHARLDASAELVARITANLGHLAAHFGVQLRAETLGGREDLKNRRTDVHTSHETPCRHAEGGASAMLTPPFRLIEC